MKWVMPSRLGQSLYLAGFFVFFILIEAPVFGVGVEYEGYFRTRYNFHYNLNLDMNDGPEVRAYTDMRFRLNPTFHITDKIRVRSSLNFLDGQLGDNPLRSTSYANPARTYDPYMDPTEAEAAVGRSQAANTNSVYGGAQSPDAWTRSQGLTPIQLRRVWLEIDTELGVVRVGRMPNDFGLGIFANGGDEWNQEVGSSRDRIVFDSGIGSYYLRPGMGWMIEGNLDQSSDDMMEYFFIFGRKTDHQDLGLYISYLTQDRADVANNGNLAGTETSYWAFDFYGMHQFNNFEIAGELVFVTGDYQNKDLIAFNSVVQGKWNPKKYSFLMEAGYSSGTSDAEAAAGEIKTYAFSRDYDVAYLLFEEALPGGPTLTSSSGAEDGVSTAPHSGAISNTYYTRLKFGYKVASFFEPYLNIVVPFAAKQAQGAGGKFYGFEYDLITLWPVNEYLLGEFTFAHFFPGSFFKNITETESTILLRAGIAVKF